MFIGLSITTLVIINILLDQMGWFGYKQPSSPLRTVGGVLMIGGV